MTIERRTVIKGAAWTLPVIAATVNAPLANASGSEEPKLYRIEARGGVGWYPYQRFAISGPGVIQFDTNIADTGDEQHHFRILGTEAGQTISDLYGEIFMSPNVPSLVWESVPGSNPNWSAPVFSHEQDGYRVYRYNYVGPPIEANDAVTDIPIHFGFRAPMNFVSGATFRQVRYAVVDGSLVSNVATSSNLTVRNRWGYDVAYGESLFR